MNSFFCTTKQQLFIEIIQQHKKDKTQEHPHAFIKPNKLDFDISTMIRHLFIRFGPESPLYCDTLKMNDIYDIKRLLHMAERVDEDADANEGVKADESNIFDLLTCDAFTCDVFTCDEEGRSPSFTEIRKAVFQCCCSLIDHICPHKDNDLWAFGQQTFYYIYHLVTGRNVFNGRFFPPSFWYGSDQDAIRSKNMQPKNFPGYFRYLSKKAVSGNEYEMFVDMVVSLADRGVRDEVIKSLVFYMNHGISLDINAIHDQWIKCGLPSFEGMYPVLQYILDEIHSEIIYHEKYFHLHTDESALHFFAPKSSLDPPPTRKPKRNEKETRTLLLTKCSRSHIQYLGESGVSFFIPKDDMGKSSHPMEISRIHAQ